MAWPSTALTSYLPGTTPWIKADDLNAFQSAINGIINGTYSHKALVVDGTGGSVVSPTAGTVRVSSSVSGQSNVAPFGLPTVPIGELNREQILLGAAHVLMNPFTPDTISGVGGFNVRRVVRSSTGVFVVVFNNAFPNSYRHVAQVTTILDVGGGTFVTAFIEYQEIVAGEFKVHLQFRDVGGVLRDPGGFNVTVVGG